MPKVKFIDAEENVTEIDIEPGENVMSLALDNMVDGVLGECGGAMACATCHCYIDKEQQEHFEPASMMEEAMLEMVPDRRENSRLSCQLELTEETPDIEIHLPSSQH